jgi:hypothetical protein
MGVTMDVTRLYYILRKWFPTVVAVYDTRSLRGDYCEYTAVVKSRSSEHYGYIGIIFGENEITQHGIKALHDEIERLSK